MTATAFQPEGTVTRQQATTFLYRYVTEYLEQEAAQGCRPEGLYRRRQGAGLRQDRHGLGYGRGSFFEGYGDGTLRPRASLTRAQMAKLLTILDQDF